MAWELRGSSPRALYRKNTEAARSRKGGDMKVTGVGLSELYRFADEVGVQLYNVRPDGRGTSFVLRPLDGDHYRATNAEGRRKWAVCFHGHYDFMERMFHAYPDAKLRSAMAKFDGLVGFENWAGVVGEANVGSLIRPLAFKNSCKCAAVSVKA